MYKSTDPTERFKDLTPDQLLKVDQFAVRLLTTGDAFEPADFYKIQKENENLKAQLETLNNSKFSFENIAQQVKKLSVQKNYNNYKPVVGDDGE